MSSTPPDNWPGTARAWVNLNNRVTELEQLLELQRGLIDRLAARDRKLTDALRDVRNQTGVAIPDELLEGK